MYAVSVISDFFLFDFLNGGRIVNADNVRHTISPFVANKSLSTISFTASLQLCCGRVCLMSYPCDTMLSFSSTSSVVPATGCSLSYVSYRGERETLITCSFAKLLHGFLHI